MARRVSSPELIGREGELAALAAAFARARDGEFASVLLGGEAGVGKTRLLGELELRVVADGGRVLGGECVELAEGELPFAPLTAALRPLARELAPGELETLPGREELARLLPEFGDAGEALITRDSALDERLAQSRLFEVLLALFARVGEETPLVLAIEDLHWADRSTRDFLGFLVRNAHDARMLVLATFRTDELHRRHPLRPFLAELDRRPGVERIDLEPLDREETRNLLAAILEERPEESLVDELFHRSDGNPFFAEELIAASSEGRRIPGSLRDALLVRVEALSEPARELLRTAAAAGRRVSHGLLSEVAGLPAAELDDLLREAVAANVLVQDGETYSFRHALVREAVFTDILPGERTKLHASLAQALAGDPSLAQGAAGAGAAELAHHWLEARRLPEALSSFLAAGAAAEDAFAFAEAHRHLEHALEIWDEVDDAEERAGMDLAAVLARAADNASLILDPVRATALVRKAIELVDEDANPVRAALLRERLGRYLWLGGDAEASLRAYHAGVDLMPPEPPTAELARVLAAHGQILMLRGRPRESRERCEQAIEVARAAGARAEEAHALNTLGVDISSLGDRARGIEYLREAKAIAEELGWVDEIGRGYVNLSEEIDWEGDTAAAAEMAVEAAETMRRLGARSYVVFLETEAAHRLIRLGRLEEAEQALERVRAAGSTGYSHALQWDAEAEIALLRGELERAAEAVREGRSALGKTRDSMYFGPSAAVETEVALASGRADAAVAAFEGALEAITGEQYAVSVARLYARGVRAYVELVETKRAVGDDDEVARLEAAADAAVASFDSILAQERHPEGTPPPIALAYRRTIAGELSRLRGGSDPGVWADAVAAWGPLGDVFERVYAQWRAAEAVLGGGGSRAEALAHLTAAAQAAKEAGATALLAEIEGLARRARLSLTSEGAEVEPTASDGERFGLTERELEVLVELAEGRTNREIGERLFISEKTVSVHVSRILAKLEVRGRVEAATKAQRIGILALEGGAAAAPAGPEGS